MLIARHYIETEFYETEAHLTSIQNASLQHITSMYLILSSTGYSICLRSVCKILHCNLAFKYNLVVIYHPYYKCTPQKIFENDRVKLPWDYITAIDHSVDYNRLDLVLLFK